MSNNAEQYTVKTPAIVKFLLGESDYQGRWYGDVNDDAPFWWRTPLRKVVEELIKENERLKGTLGVECVKQLLAAREENAKLKKFKEYVHCRLDAMGIPSDPEPDKNAEHGCRIEGHLNYIESKISTKER